MTTYNNPIPTVVGGGGGSGISFPGNASVGAVYNGLGGGDSGAWQQKANKITRITEALADNRAKRQKEVVRLARLKSVSEAYREAETTYARVLEQECLEAALRLNDIPPSRRQEEEPDMFKYWNEHTHVLDRSLARRVIKV
jgi:hypothetical protein